MATTISATTRQTPSHNDGRTCLISLRLQPVETKADAEQSRESTGESNAAVTPIESALGSHSNKPLDWTETMEKARRPCRFSEKRNQS